MWTMPRRTLQIVAVLLLICAVGGFYMGFRGAPGRARLPGEDLSGGAGAPIAAPDVRPLVETAETPAMPEPEPEKAKEEEAPAEVAEAPPPKAAQPAPPAAPAPKAPAADQDQVGDLLDKVAPPVETPIY